MKLCHIVYFWIIVGLLSHRGQSEANQTETVKATDLTQQVVAAVKLGKDKKFDLAAKKFSELVQFWQIHTTAALYLKICRDIDRVIEKKHGDDVFKAVYEDHTGETKKGLKRIRKVSKNYRDYLPLYLVQAGMHAHLNNAKEALEIYDSAIALAPDSSLPYLFRGKYYVAVEESDGAIADFSKAIELDSASAIALFERGFSYCLEKKYTLAIKDFEAAVKYFPAWSQSTVINEAYHNRGLQFIEGKAYQKAVADFGQAIAINPDFLNSYLSRGIAYRNLKSYTKAMRDFNYCIEQKADFTEAYYNRAVTSYRRRLYKKAVADLEIAARLVPSDARIQFKLAESYYRLGDYLKAVRHFDQAIQSDGRQYWAYYWQGYAYAGLRKAKQAVAAFENFLALVPKNYTRQIASAKAEIRQLKK